MYTHRIIADSPELGRLVIYFEYVLRRLPNKGIERAYCPTIGKVIEFDFSEILESEVIAHELV